MPYLVIVLISNQGVLLVRDYGKLRLNSYNTGWWAMITVLYSQINGKWQSSEVDPYCMWITHFWQNALSICQVAYLQHSDRYLSTLLSLPACTEPKAQAGWELRAFIWLSWEHCLGLVLYACMWSSRFPIILQRFSKPSHFEFFLLNVFTFTLGCPRCPKGPQVKQLPVISYDKYPPSIFSQRNSCSMLYKLQVISV